MFCHGQHPMLEAKKSLTSLDANSSRCNYSTPLPEKRRVPACGPAMGLQRSLVHETERGSAVKSPLFVAAASAQETQLRLSVGPEPREGRRGHRRDR